MVLLHGYAELEVIDRGGLGLLLALDQVLDVLEYLLGLDGLALEVVGDHLVFILLLQSVAGQLLDLLLYGHTLAVEVAAFVSSAHFHLLA